MKNGFHPELTLNPSDIQRGDDNIPLRKFAGPTIMKIKEKLELPDQYCRTCTLREGTIATMIIYQIMALGTVVVVSMLLIWFPDQTTAWWKEKFRNDLDFYYSNEYPELRKELVKLWKPIAYAVIAAHAALFMTGWLIVYALRKKHASPYCYLPWIILSSLMSFTLWLVIGAQFIVIFIMTFFREITVMWDLVPIVLCIVYGVGWTYSCAVVIAQFRRRTIVKYWRSKRHLLGTENYPPEVNEYLYEYASEKSM